MSDIVIIGGGIAGLSAAAHLAPHARVTLLEREPALAYHASGRSAAIYLHSYGNRVVRALNEASLDGHRQAGVLSPRGMLKLGAAGQEDLLASEAAEMGFAPVDLDFAAQKFPILDWARVTRAAWLPEAQALDADALCQHYARAARAAGARILTRQPVTRITPGRRWQVETGEGSQEADIVVNAAGAWADRVAALAGLAPMGLRALRRSMAVLPAPGGHDVSTWPFTESAGETWYAKPEGGRLVVSPSEEDELPPHDAYADDMVIAEGLARYESMVTIPVTRVETTWAGFRSFAPDRALVLGFERAAPGFLWCAGQGGYGLQTAPAAGRLIADLALGRAPVLDAASVAALSPGRFDRPLTAG